MIQANIGTHQVSEKQIMHPYHAPIAVPITAKADNGTLAAGLLLAKNSTGELVAYDRAGAEPTNTLVGVLANALDTTKTTSAAVIIHGSVVDRNLVHKDSEITEADRQALLKLGIYPLA